LHEILSKSCKIQVLTKNIIDFISFWYREKMVWKIVVLFVLVWRAYGDVMNGPKGHGEKD
jgi:hypothetical protein